MGEGVVGVDGAAVTDGGEVADTDGVYFASDRHTVPDCSVLGDEDTAYEGRVRSHPSGLSLRYLIVKWKELSVARQVKLVSDVVVHSRSESVHR